jgi:hypothetical protein
MTPVISASMAPSDAILSKYRLDACYHTANKIEPSCTAVLIAISRSINQKLLISIKFLGSRLATPDAISYIITLESNMSHYFFLRDAT